MFLLEKKPMVISEPTTDGHKFWNILIFCNLFNIYFSVAENKTDRDYWL